MDWYLLDIKVLTDILCCGCTIGYNIHSCFNCIGTVNGYINEAWKKVAHNSKCCTTKLGITG